MPALSQPSTGVIGDFMLAIGPSARDALPKLEGFSREDSGGVSLATRGAVRRGVGANGDAWIALADLVAGDPAESTRTLHGETPQSGWRGRFALVAWNAQEQKAVAVTDHFSTLSIYALERGDTLLLATDLRLLMRSAACSRDLDPVAIYHYLNFGCIPAPYTVCRDIRRITPGTAQAWQAGRTTATRYFLPEYPEDISGSDESLAEQLRERIVADVRAYRPPAETPWGCFLSGGTDSSSIVSILASEDRDARVRSFSIGFAEEGYDELGYARLVAEACGADPYSARVSQQQTIDMIDQIVAAYDQPFGNASAIPTMACAELARSEQVDMLLAGDGGDEIFGGNERYAKDQVMGAFYRLPGPVKAFCRAIGRGVGGGSNHFLNRIENFFERSSLPNPDRFYTDDSFGSDYYDELLTPAFRDTVARDASMEFMRGVYALGGDAGSLHRIMRLDLMMAIAQNDLVKVQGACKAHAVSVRFPYLDPSLVAYLGRLPPRHKVRGVKKRYLFKRAMDGILPADVLRKKKQGFGLPIAVWLREDPGFQNMVRDVLFDPRTAQRGIFAPAFVEKLIAEHARGGWDHASQIWQLLILELWLRSHFDAA